MNRKLIIYLLFTIVFASCKILRPTRIKMDGEYNGIEKLSCNNQTKKGCSDTKGQKYLIIHGIGSQDDDYSKKMIQRLSKHSFKGTKYQRKFFCLKGEDFVQIPGVNLIKEMKGSTPTGQIHVLKVVDESIENINDSLKKRNIYYSINWSVLSTEVKIQFKKDEFNNGPEYTGINKEILKKIVMMEKVSDAFNGSKPDAIIPIIKTISTIIMKEEIYKEENINLISGSFGSQLFLGSMIRLYNHNTSNNSQFLNYLNNETQIDSIISPKLFEIFAEEIQRNPNLISGQKLNMFLLTNQINLMNNNILGWFNLDLKDSIPITPLNYKDVQIVAFRNPNDILCYYLPKRVADELFKGCVESNSIKVYNGYYFNWPIRNDVATAHTCVFNLKKLAKAIYFGTDAWGVKVKKVKVHR